MKIDQTITCGECNDIQRIRIASLLRPTDTEAHEFLRVYLSEDTPGQRQSMGFRNEMLIAVATFERGETFASASKKVRAHDWRFGTLADWYRYLGNGGIFGNENISLPNETYHDEDLHAWYPRVTYNPQTLKKLTSAILLMVVHAKSVTDRTLADISMKQLRMHAPFKAETKFLVTTVKLEKLK